MANRSMKEVLTGTTIMACTYDGGVILGADSRTSSGNYVANKVADKITKVCDKVYLCRSGSAAHTQAVAGYANLYLNQHAIELGEKGVGVRSAACIVKEIAYSNKGWMNAGMIVAGWDKKEGGKVFAVPMGGTLMEVPFAVGGSGSIYINAFVDKNFRPNMTKEECKAFVRKAVSLAISRDGSSGGVIRTVTVNEDEQVKEFLPGNQVQVYQDEMSTPTATPAVEFVN
jgi:20S proteasome subunit beta 1